MEHHLQTGYTSVELHRRRYGVEEIPVGQAHVVIMGKRDTVCGQVVRITRNGPPRSEEPQCLDCIELLQDVDYADWPI